MTNSDKCDACDK